MLQRRQSVTLCGPLCVREQAETNGDHQIRIRIKGIESAGLGFITINKDGG